jgi:hypothetical protein
LRFETFPDDMNFDRITSTWTTVYRIRHPFRGRI